MKFCDSEYLKPIINGEIDGNEIRMLIDTGSDYTILNVPKFEIKKNEDGSAAKDNYGRYKKQKKYLDSTYDDIIRNSYGSFVIDKKGQFIKTTVHGFGDTTTECRLIILKHFSFESYHFNDSYVLLDENGFASNHDMVLGTSCLRNFSLAIDYENREIKFEQKTKDLALRYDGITKDSNMINCGIVLPTDIYLNDYVIDV